MRRNLVRAGRFAWPLIQGAAAATVAWVIAKYVFDHPQPFFAPVAAVIGLNAALGERGLNVVRLLQGVVTGIAVGEVVLNLVGQGWAAMALAIFVATAIARATGGVRIVVAQAAVGAILIVALGDPEAGPDRLIDAFIGGAVALVFSQLLFTPEPLGLVRRAEKAALGEMAAGLELSALALRQADEQKADEALDRLRGLRDHLGELARSRKASGKIARRSVAWRSQRSPLVHENENAGHLDLLGASCLMLARTALARELRSDNQLTPLIEELAAAVGELAQDPGDRATRQEAAGRALRVGRSCQQLDRATHSPLDAAAVAVVDVVAMDVMIFSGAEPERATSAVLAPDTEVLDVAPPPDAPRRPFRRG